MKTSKSIILILLSVLFCRCTSDNISDENGLTIASGSCFPEVNGKYIYPVTPGMQEWQTSDDIYKLVQLPDNVLKSISTFGLIDALVNSPLFVGFYLLSGSSSPVETWHNHYERFNCSEELFHRNDAGEALLAYYKLVCLDCIEPSAVKEVVSASEVYERIMGIEFLFTKQEILDKIGHEEKRELVAALLEKYEQMPDKEIHTIPMAFVMFADKYEPIVNYYQDNTESFQPVLRGYFSSHEQVDLIISFAKSFVKK